MRLFYAFVTFSLCFLRLSAHSGKLPRSAGRTRLHSAAKDMDFAVFPARAEPSAANDFYSPWLRTVEASLRRLRGTGVLGSNVDAASVYADPQRVLLSHALVPSPDPNVGPVFNYGNKAAQELFEMSWGQLTSTPSRKSAEEPDRAERERLLNTVNAQGFIEDYKGLRVSSTGKRFYICDALVWNVLDEQGNVLGQAASFLRKDVQPVEAEGREAEGRAVASVGSGSNVLKSFRLMCYSFAVNHACATAALSLASTRFGLNLGGLSSGALYLAYTVSALVFATPTVNRLGPKTALTASLGLYCAYVAEFAASSVLGAGSEYALLLTGSVLGGIAAGVLWTAEGAYFSAAVDAFRKETGSSGDDGVEAKLRATFARTFLGGEVAVKLLSSALLFSLSDNLAFTALFGLSLASAGAAWFIKPFQSEKQAESRRDIGGVLRALFVDKRSYMLLPLNLAFGLGVAFLQLQVNGNVLAENLGPASVGILSTVAIGAAALSSDVLTKSLPFWLSISIGAFGFFAMGSGFGWALDGGTVARLVSENAYLFAVPFFVLWGLARSTWEGPFKAFFAQFYGKDASLAFSVTIIQSGLASAIGFLTFPNVAMQFSGALVSFSAVVAAAVLLSAQRAGLTDKEHQQ